MLVPCVASTAAKEDTSVRGAHVEVVAAIEVLTLAVVGNVATVAATLCTCVLTCPARVDTAIAMAGATTACVALTDACSVLASRAMAERRLALTASSAAEVDTTDARSMLSETGAVYTPATALAVAPAAVAAEATLVVKAAICPLVEESVAARDAIDVDNEVLKDPTLELRADISELSREVTVVATAIVAADASDRTASGTIAAEMEDCTKAVLL